MIALLSTDFSVLDSISMRMLYESPPSLISTCVEITTKNSEQFVGQRKEERGKKEEK